VASFTDTGFDSLFGDPLRQLMERAKAEGYNPAILSGVRTDEDQRQLVANAAATRAGRPLPYPNRGPVRKAAPVGFSPHEYGVAGDVSGVPQAELQRLGSQVGLNTIPDDPGHLELANWRQVAADQAPPTPWSQVADIPSSYAQNAAAPIAPAPGVTLNSSPFLKALQHFESGGRNISNTHQGTSSGQAQGFNQITTGTWDEFGGKKFAISPLQATYDQQNAVAANIPMKRWAPETLSYLSQQGFKVDPSQTLGQNIAANSVGPGPGNVGPVTGFLPGAPTGQGGIGGDVAAAGNLATQGGATAPVKPNAADQLAGSLKPLEDALKPEQQPQQRGDPGEQMLAQQIQSGMAAQQAQQVRMAQSAQMMALLQQKGAQPLHWGSAPPGYGIAGGLIQPPGAPTPTPGGGQIGGTTLNSMGDFYG
jgi:hypothetical protein